MAGQDAVDFDPVPKEKLTRYQAQLRSYTQTLPTAQQSRFSEPVLKDLAESLLDGTVFDIVRELEDIQQLSERSLLNKRMKVVSSHKAQLVRLSRRHSEELVSTKPHALAVALARQEEEKAELERTLAEEVRSTDQKIILELDQLLSDQQSTLMQAAVPFFAVTNKPEDIQLQMNILRFLQKLGHH